MLLIPKMHSGLIADFDVGVQVLEQFPRPDDDSVFRLIRGVFIKMDQVIVPDACLRVPAVQHVPNSLKQRPGSKPPVRDTQQRRQLYYFPVDRFLLNVARKSCSSLVVTAPSCPTPSHNWWTHEVFLPVRSRAGRGLATAWSGWSRQRLLSRTSSTAAPGPGGKAQLRFVPASGSADRQSGRTAVRQKGCPAGSSSTLH